MSTCRQATQQVHERVKRVQSSGPIRTCPVGGGLISNSDVYYYSVRSNMDAFVSETAFEEEEKKRI